MTKNESMLREMESERRNQEIIENNTKMFQEELFRIHGETELHNTQQQDIIDYYVNHHIHVPPPLPPPLPFTEKKKTVISSRPYAAKTRPYAAKHLQAVEMSQQSRQPRAASSSNNGPESTHEKKGPVGRPSHGVPTESRKVLFIGKPSQPNSLEHNYQIEDGEYLIFNISQPKVQLQSD